MSRTPSFISLTQPRIKQIEDLIRGQSEGFHPAIKEALEILLSSGGKRLRPVVTLLTGDLLGANQSQLLTSAASIELLHTATLVHDDLIDSSLLRRGSPTLNARWSPAATVLTGDFLFARAAHLATSADSIAVNRLFAETLSRIVNGELNQMLDREITFSMDAYNKRIESKTAALFQTAARISGLLSQPKPEMLEAVTSYGYHIGMAFQIMDDILDFSSDEKTLGKPVGNDLSQGIVTLPVILCSKRNKKTLAEQISCMLANHDRQILNSIIESIKNRGCLQQAFGIAKEHVESAISQLDLFSDSIEKDALKELAFYVADREV